MPLKNNFYLINTFDQLDAEKDFCLTSVHIVQLYILLVSKIPFISQLLKQISHLRYITS